MPSHTAAPSRAVALATALALAVPMNVAFDVPPSATVLNQALAWLGWGVVASLLVAPPWRATVRARGHGAVVAALALYAAAALSTPWWTGVPASISMSIAASAGAAGLLVHAGATVAAAGYAPGGRGDTMMQALALAIVVGALLAAAIGLVQVFAPQFADSAWIAAPSHGARAAGNLRQPNHLATLLLWGAIALVGLLQMPRYEHALPVIAAAFGGLVLVVVLTASRTGVLGVLLLAAWGAIDRALPRRARVLLLAAPLFYCAVWLTLAALSAADGASPFAGAERLRQADPTTARLAVWANAFDLLARAPWVGVGAGGFNFAWTLSDMAHRPRQFFDHTHNLPLQLLAETGWLMGAVLVLLLATSLWQGIRVARSAAGQEAAARRCLLVMVLMAGLHSQLEYPLWYAYFLLPTALMWGLLVGRPASQDMSAEGRLRLGRMAWPAAVLVALAGPLIVYDYARVVGIFVPARDATPLDQRIERGRGSWFFGHHADYALVTTAARPGAALAAFARPTHYLLDARLMIAWARALHESGDTDRARWLVQRLAEFGHADAREFLAVCETALRSPLPFQCEPPLRHYRFGDFD